MTSQTTKKLLLTAASSNKDNSLKRQNTSVNVIETFIQTPAKESNLHKNIVIFADIILLPRVCLMLNTRL